MESSVKKFHVYVDDNAHYMDDSSGRFHAVYDSYEAASRACRFIVESSVNEIFDYDFTEDENYNLYRLYGESPWFEPQGEGEAFSAQAYAREFISILFKLKCYLD
jgi:hypothetical protein